jgi:glutathione S-transferase
MSEPITFYYNPFSRGRIAHWMLEEVGAEYRVVLLDFDQKEHKRPEFLALNPMGKIPTIVHRGVVVTEAAAICTYLAEVFPRAGLAPEVGDPARATYLRWLFFGAGCLEPAMVDKMLSRPLPDRPGALGYGSYEDTLNALEQALRPGPFVLKDRFSAADVYLAAEVEWGLMTKALESRPTFSQYVERCRQRPGYQSFVAKSQACAAELKGRGGGKG